MKKLLLLIACLGLLGANVCFGQEAEQPLQLTIQSDKQVYALGDTITISCILKNNSATIVELYPYIPRGVRFQSKEGKPCFPEIFQRGEGVLALITLKPEETYQYSFTGNIAQKEGVIGDNVSGAEEIISGKGSVLYKVYGLFVEFKYPATGKYYLGNYGKYEMSASFKDANKMSQEYRNATPEEQEAFLKDKWSGSISSNTITIEVAEKKTVEKKEIISRDKALEIAVNYLRKQPGADQYLEDSAEVTEDENEWWVYFKHIDIELQLRRPNHCLIVVNKETGEPEWRPLR